MPALAAWLTAVAFAGTVVHDGVPDPISRVRELTGARAVDLVSLPAAELRRGAPEVVGGIGLPCEAAPLDNAALGATLRKIAGRLYYMEYDAALGAVSRTAEALPCLTEPVDTALLARLRYLEGMGRVFSGVGDPEDAFVDALVADPDLAWDDKFGAKGRDAFEAARARVLAAPRTLRLQVVAPQAEAWVDGQPVTGAVVALRPGTHLVQVGRPVAGIALVAGAGEARVVVPAAFPPAPLALAAEPDGRVALESLLEAADVAEPVYVVTDQSVWRVAPGGGEWAALRRPPPPPTLLVAGGVLIAGGLASAAGAELAAREAVAERCAADSTLAFVDAADRVRRWQTTRNVAFTGAGIGAVVLGAGVAVRLP